MSVNINVEISTIIVINIDNIFVQPVILFCDKLQRQEDDK